jgi:peptidoglycan/xylan/chitin deacetylase (PgdA/CDA1 family)
MSKQGTHLSQRHTGRRLAILASLLVLALVTGVSGMFGGSAEVARQGPFPVHPRTPATVPNDRLGPEVPGAAQPATVSIPVGPNLVVPILYYHYIRTIAPTPQNLLSFGLSISPGLFARQMALLEVEGAHTITLATLMQALQGRTRLPSHPVVLTFDDGYADFATAAEPVLLKHGFVATAFVVSGFVNRPRYMTAAQVRQMDADGMVIGAHTVHHVDLASIPPAAARTEIDNSLAALEALLGHPVLDFAYPYGGFTTAVEQLVQQAGFRDAVTTVGGVVQSLTGCFAFHRTDIGGAPSLADFARDAGLPPPSAADQTRIVDMTQVSALHDV